MLLLLLLLCVCVCVDACVYLRGLQTTSGKIARKHNLKAYMERFNADDVRVFL